LDEGNSNKKPNLFQREDNEKKNQKLNILSRNTGPPQIYVKA
jgi:hypothetical protein